MEGVIMSKGWYPYIDISKCNGCLACIEYCEYGVFGENNIHGRKVYVKSKEQCIKGCKECQNSVG